jgi:hypothetical protein
MIKYNILRIYTILATAFIPYIFVPDAGAALIVSNWNITPTTLSFDIIGTLDQTFSGNRDQTDIFIGELNNSNWAISAFLTGTITDNGSSIAGPNVITYAWNGSPDGDVAYLRYLSKWQTGNIFNYSVSYSGNFNPAAVDVSNLGVFWGLYSDRWLQPQIQVGTAIPELSSIIYIACATFGMVILRRRSTY